MFDDRITIVYNTSFNPAEEIYKRIPNNLNDDQNNGGTTIHKRELELPENDKKNCRLIIRSNDNSLAEDTGFEPADAVNVNGFQDRRFKPLSQSSMP